MGTLPSAPKQNLCFATSGSPPKKKKTNSSNLWSRRSRHPHGAGYRIQCGLGEKNLVAVVALAAARRLAREQILLRASPPARPLHESQGNATPGNKLVIV